MSEQQQKRWQIYVTDSKDTEDRWVADRYAVRDGMLELTLDRETPNIYCYAAGAWVSYSAEWGVWDDE